MKRVGLRLVVVVALLIAAGVPIAWSATRPTESAGSLARFEQRSNANETNESRAVRSVVNPGSRSGRIEDTPIGPTTPASIRVESIGVDAVVQSVGLQPSGAMEIPDAVSQVGWYRLGAVPGRAGSAVLAGHVDSLAQGQGAFFRLRELEPGARITVTDTRGAAHTFEVVARRQFPKQELPEDIFDTTGAPRLALITCGGDFDSSARSYRDNIIVYAVAV